MKKIVVALALSLLSTAAFAGAGTITVLDSTGTTKTYDVITDGSGNFLSKMGICDQAAGATCASVGTAGSPSTNALTVQAVTLGHGTAANAMRVELPTDGTGVVTARTTGNIGGVFDAVVAGTYPANAVAVGVLNGSAIGRLVGDETNGLWVNIKAGAGSGGTAIADNAAFTTGSTSETPIGCYAGTPSATANHSTIVACTTAGSVHTTVDNTNANGQATMANSSPVVIASNQSNVPTNTAQINGVTPLTGNGVSGTGSQRVNIASDNTAFPIINAPSAASGNALTAVTCGSAVSSCVLKNAAGNFYGVYAECTSACWLMVFNSASAPSNGSTTAGTGSGNLVECVDVAANSVRSVTYPVLPPNYSVGITAAISSTACATLTLSAVGFIRGTVM